MMGLLSGQVNSGKTLTSASGMTAETSEGFSKIIGNMLSGSTSDGVKSLLRGNAGMKNSDAPGEKELLTQLKQMLEELDANIQQLLKDALELKKDASSSFPQGGLTENENLNHLLKEATADELTVLQNLLSERGKGTAEIDAEMQLQLASLVEKMEKHVFQDEGELPVEWKELIASVKTLLESVTDNPRNHAIAGGQLSTDTYQNIISADRTSAPENKLETLFQKFQQILQSQGEGKQLTNEQLKTLKDLLMTYAKTAEGRGGSINLDNTSGTKEEKAVFQQLLTNVTRKQQMPSAYNQQQISMKDMAKWMSQATAKVNKEEVNLKQTFTEQKSTFSHQTPMTKVEQFVIKVDQQSSTPAQKQVFQQMQEMIQSSRMFTEKAGNQEMQIKLKPGSLGEMTIKFTQISGEMAVKIMVTSQAAKEILEGNMQQLRHMFSPQQVVIEKTDQSLTQQFLSEEEADASGEKEQKPSDENFEGDGEDEENTGEVLSFSDILNEKV